MLKEVRMMSLLVSRGWPIVVVALILAFASFSIAQPQKSIKFSKGEFEFKYQGNSYKLPLLALGSSLDTYKLRRKDTGMLGLVYSSQPQGVRIALEGISGVGKYGKENIRNFAVDLDVGKGWNFSKSHNDCTFSFSRLDPAGAAGTVSCKTTGSNALPFTDVKFTAMP